MSESPTGTPSISPTPTEKKYKVAKFLSSLRVKKEDNDTWTLLSNFKYYSLLIKRVIIVPKKFNTDFASVPRLPLVFLLGGDTAHKAAVIHDFCYRSDDSTKESRKIADDIFLEAMTVSNIPVWRRQAMYRAVRMFGNNSYKVTVPVEEPAKPETSPIIGD